MRTGVIVSARTGSRRLPGKALLPLLGLPSVVFLLYRLRSTRRADTVILATTTLSQDDVLARRVAEEGFPVFRGHPDNLIERYVAAADEAGLDRVVRVTGDCPFVDGESLDYCLEACDGLGNWDLATTKGAFPVGIDFEIFSADSMLKIHAEPDLSADHREHLTLYYYDNRNKFNIKVIEPRQSWHSQQIFTLDTQADYERFQHLVGKFTSWNVPIPDLIEAAETESLLMS